MRLLIASALLIATTALSSAQAEDMVFRAQLNAPIFFAHEEEASADIPPIMLPGLGVLRANATIEILPALVTPLEGVTWSTVPELPDFLRIDPQTGRISGIVPLAKNFGTFTVKAERHGRTSDAELRLDIAAEAIKIGTIANISTTGGLQIDVPIPFSAGEGARTYEWIDAELAPAWLRFQGDRIAGTAAEASVSGLKIKVKDATGESISEPFSLTVAAPGAIVAGSSAVVRRHDFEARCAAWSGTLCIDPQLRATGAGWWSYASTYGGTPPMDQWTLLSWGDQPKIAAMFCLIATGSPSVHSQAVKLTDFPVTGWRIQFDGTSLVTYPEYFPLKRGSYSPPGVGGTLNIFKSQNQHRLETRCSSWAA